MLGVISSVFCMLLCIQTNTDVLVHYRATVAEAATKVATAMTSEGLRMAQTD